MSFWDHLEDLRWCFIRSILAVIACSIFCYYFNEKILSFLLAPSAFEGSRISFQILKLTSMFNVTMSTSMLGGLFISMPYIFLQIYRFVLPALNAKAKKYTFLLSLFSSLFFLAGFLFSYFVLIPFSVKFFSAFNSNSNGIESNISLIGYLSYIVWIIILSGIIFQFPIITLLFTKLGIFTSEFLRQFRRIAIMGFFIFGAILTPPDVVSQIIFVIPMVILYEISIFICRIAENDK